MSRGQPRFFDSIQNKIFIGVLALVSVLVALTSLLVYYNASQVIKEDARSFMTSTLYNIDSNLSDLHSRAVNLMLRIAINDNVRAMLREDFPKASYDEFTQHGTIDTLIENQIAQESWIERVMVIRSDGKSSSSGNTILMRDETATLYERSLQFDGDSFFITEGNMYCYRPIYMNSGGDGAIVLVDLDEDYVTSMFSRSRIAGMDIYTLCADGQIFTRTSEKNPREELETIFSTIAASGDSTPQDVALQQGRYLVSVRPAEGTGLTTIGLVPYREIFSNSLRVLYMAIALIAFSCIVSIFLSWFLSRLITRDLRSLRISMLKISQGNISERTKIPKTQELRDLAIIFNSMMDRMDDLMEETTEKEIEKQNLMQNYLATQIRPHFVYNTLNIIRIMASEKGEEDLALATGALIELLRAIVGKNDQYTTLLQEAEYARQYSYLYNFRNKSDIKIDLDIQEEIENTLVPILILQPLVENACIHGLGGMQSGCITIKAWKTDDRLNLAVHDDGVGFDGVEKVGSRLYGIGITNVVERLKLTYGDDASFRITSSHGQGTTVELAFRC